MNRLGLCIIYDKLERIDTSLATRTIQLAGNNRVLVLKTIDNSAIIHGAVDNYDNRKVLLPGSVPVMTLF